MKGLEAIIREYGVVTTGIREKYFKSQGFGYIRTWLEEHGLDKHMPIELKSTEICIITPFGVIMQIRPSDHDQLGLWGGVLEEGETPEEGALRELEEETGLELPVEALEFVEENEHKHVYGNGDVAIFHSYRFKVVLDYIPDIRTDEESTGVFMVVHTILEHQQEFIKRILGEIG